MYLNGATDLRQLGTLLDAHVESIKRKTDCFMKDLKKRR